MIGTSKAWIFGKEITFTDNQSTVQQIHGFKSFNGTIAMTQSKTISHSGFTALCVLVSGEGNGDVNICHTAAGTTSCGYGRIRTQWKSGETVITYTCTVKETSFEGFILVIY